jgi:hypothetical protein
MESNYSADGGPVLDMFVMATIRYLYHYCRGLEKKKRHLPGGRQNPLRFLVGAPASVPSATEMTDLTFVKNDGSKHGENSYCITLSDITEKNRGPILLSCFKFKFKMKVRLQVGSQASGLYFSFL